MKPILFLCVLVLSIYSKAQALLTKDYIAYEILNPLDLKENQYYYTWHFMGYGFIMNFPTTKSGLQNLNEKALTIASASKLNKPSWDKSIIPDKFKDETDPSVLYSLIIGGVISLNIGYVIGDKTMIIDADKENFRLRIDKND